MRIEIDRLARVTLSYRTATDRRFGAQVVGWIRRQALWYRGDSSGLSALLPEEDAGGLLRLIGRVAIDVPRIPGSLAEYHFIEGWPAERVKLTGSPVYGSRPADERRTSVTREATSGPRGPLGEFYRVVRQYREGEYRESILDANSLTDEEILALPPADREAALAEIGMEAEGGAVVRSFRAERGR